MIPPISTEFAKRYIDQLLDLAGKLPETGPMRTAVLQRADAVMDFVKAWKEHCEKGGA